MRQRGRKSSAGLAVVVDVGRRMPAKAPAELTDAQPQVWRQVVSEMAAGWMASGAEPILVQFCRHVCRARLLEAQIARFEFETTGPGGLERLDKMLGMADRETRAALACARSLRLTPQRQMHARTAARKATAPAGKRPWDD